jgi:hypothetical protein
LLRLMDVGFDFDSADDSVPKKHVAKVRQFLGLAATPVKARALLVSSLAARSGLTEAETRTRLRDAGVIRKRRLSRVPRFALYSAEIALGLVTPTNRPAANEAEEVVAPKQRTRTKKKTRKQPH